MYPSIVAVREATLNNDISPKLVPMPGVIDTGDLLMMCFDLNGTFNIAVTTPISWTLSSSAGNGDTSKLFGKTADGTEDGTNVSVSHDDFGGTQFAVTQTLRITGWSQQNPIGSDVASASEVLNGVTIDPTAGDFTPGWGPGVEKLWVSFLIIAGSADLVSQPSGWTIYRATVFGDSATIISAYYNSTDETMGSAGAGPVVWTVDVGSALISYIFAVKGGTLEGDLVVYADSPSMVIHQEVAIY